MKITKIANKMNNFLRKIIGIEEVEVDPYARYWEDFGKRRTPDYYKLIKNPPTRYALGGDYLPSKIYCTQGDYLLDDADYYFKQDLELYPRCYKTAYDYVWEGISLFEFDFALHEDRIPPSRKELERKIFSSFIDLWENRSLQKRDVSKKLYDLIGAKYRFKS